MKKPKKNNNKQKRNQATRAAKSHAAAPTSVSDETLTTSVSASAATATTPASASAPVSNTIAQGKPATTNDMIQEEKNMKTNKTTETTKASKDSKTTETMKATKDSKTSKAVKTAKAAKTAKATTLTGTPISGKDKNETYVWLNNSQLQISPDIQRKIDPMRVADIANNFSPRVANPIKVSYRDGKYFIFDGMHTRMAMTVLNGDEDFPVQCRVYYGLTKEEEAKLFALQFGNSKAVSLPYRLRALEIAKDPEVLDFLKVTRDNGFGITLGKHTAGTNHISATCEAFKVYCLLGSAKYGQMLKILHRTWAGERWSVSKNMLGGMARFMKMYNFSANSFVKTFRGVTCLDIEREVLKFPAMSKDGAYATALAEIYDRHNAGTLKETA